MNLNQYKNIYFIGIGGIGMSALARYFNNKEVNIFGYDRTSSDLCLQLEQEGMRIHYTEEINDLFSKEDTLIVYTPAIPESNLELTHFRKDNYTILKRSELLFEGLNFFYKQYFIEDIIYKKLLDYRV